MFIFYLKKTLKTNFTPVSTCDEKKDFQNHVWEHLYCTVLAVLVRNNRLSHLIDHTFYSPTTIGVTIAQLQTQEQSNSRRLSFLEAS
jgi:hypothetical protein